MQKYELTLQSMPEPACLVGMDGTTEIVNAAFRRHMAEPFDAGNITDLFTEATSAAIQQALSRTAANKRTAQFALPADPTHAWLTGCTITPLAEEGEIRAFLAVFHADEGTTAGTIATPLPQEQHNQAIHEAEATARIGHWYLDPQTEKVWLSDAFLSRLSTPETAPVQTLEWLLGRCHEDDRMAMKTAINDLVLGRCRDFRIEQRLRGKNDLARWFEINGKTIELDGSRRIICASLIEIDRRKKGAQLLQGALSDVETARHELLNRVNLLKIAAEIGHIAPWYINSADGRYELDSNLSVMLGYDPSLKIEAETIATLIHPDDAEQVRMDLDDILVGRRREVSHDFRLRRKDGNWCWLNSVAKRVVSETEEDYLICGSFIDITAHKAHERRLSEAFAEAESARRRERQSADMLHVATQCGSMGAWRFDLDGDEAWLHDEGFRMLGYEPGDFTPDFDGWHSIIHPDDQDTAEQTIQDVVDNKSASCNIEFRLRHKTGDYHWYRSIGRKIEGQGPGQSDYVAGAFTRIDEQKENEQRLADAVDAAEHMTGQARLREDLMSMAAEAGRICHLTIVPDLGESWAPDSTYRILGYDVGEIPATQEGWLALLHPDEQSASKDMLGRLFGGKLPVYVATHRIRHKDGSFHWYRVTARRIDRSAEGLPFALAGVIFNIDEQREQQRRLAEAAAAAEEAINRLNLLADNAPGALFEFEFQPNSIPKFHYSSAKLSEILGVSREGLQKDGSLVFTTMHPDDKPATKAQVDVAHARRKGFEFRHRVCHPTRGERWVFVSAIPFTHDDGRTSWFGNTLDVTDQVEAERRANDAAEALRVAHERLNTISDKSPGALFELCVYPDGDAEYRYFNFKLAQMMDVSRETLEQDALAAFAGCSDADGRPISKMFIGDPGATLPPVETQFSILHKTKGLRWMICSASPYRHPDGYVIWYGNLVDNTDRLEIEYRAAEANAEMQRAHERIRNIADVAPVGLYELRRFPDGTIDLPYTSARFEEITGTDLSLATGTPEMTFNRVDPKDLPAFLNGIEDSARDMSPWSARFRMQHPEHGLVWLAAASVPRKDPDGSIVWTGAIHDVTSDVKREAELRRAHKLAEEMRAENERQALHDGLTALPNRRYYDKRMAKRFAYARDSKVRDCVLIRVDLDHFKYVNDTLGHEAGDLVLMRVADVLRDCLRAEDFAARIGGDEFSIILAPGMSEENAREIVERIQEKLSEPLTYENRLCRFGASFGIAHTEDMTALGPELQLFADAALYKAKEGGRNRMEFFTTALHQGILNDRRLASEIHAGLEHDQFIPYFQPQISATSGELVGVETLLRWNHPEKGILSPAEFMHVAEQLRVVPEVDRLMMLKTREALGRWRAQGIKIPKVSFNVSSGRMHDPDVVSMARSMRDEDTKVAFELLESILVEEESDAFKFHVDLIRDAGIEIEIDDFGSGHASIIGLMEIAPTALKIDRRIVTPAARDRRSANLLKAIVEIAETLQISTIAEGVETSDQAAIVRQSGCDVLQGYLFSRPLSEADLSNYLLKLDDGNRQSA